MAISYKSDGFFYTFLSEATDGYDTIEWAAGLPKSNSKVGMYGFSYPGASQWLPATLRPPHLVERTSLGSERMKWCDSGPVVIQ